MRYELTTKAEDDVIDIYIAGVRDFGPEQAERYHADLKRSFELLAGQPLMARERTEFDPPVRLHFHSSHVVVYTAADDHILVIRILHSRQDWEELI